MHFVAKLATLLAARLSAALFFRVANAGEACVQEPFSLALDVNEQLSLLGLGEARVGRARNLLSFGR